MIFSPPPPAVQEPPEEELQAARRASIEAASSFFGVMRIVALHWVASCRCVCTLGQLIMLVHVRVAQAHPVPTSCLLHPAMPPSLSSLDPIPCLSCLVALAPLLHAPPAPRSMGLHYSWLFSPAGLLATSCKHRKRLDEARRAHLTKQRILASTAWCADNGAVPSSSAVSAPYLTQHVATTPQPLDVPLAGAALLHLPWMQMLDELLLATNYAMAAYGEGVCSPGVPVIPYLNTRTPCAPS